MPDGLPAPTGALVRLVVGIATVVAIVVAVVGWARPRPELTAEEATAVVVDALAAVGRSAVVDGTPVTRRYDPIDEEGQPTGAEPYEVWDVSVLVDGESITAYVPIDRGKLAFVDDTVGPDRSVLLLTAAEFDGLKAYTDETVSGDRLAENAALTIGAVLVALNALVINRPSLLTRTT